MSPPTSAYSAYENIVGALARPEMAESLRVRRAEREACTGEIDADDEAFEGRMQAFWDAAVTTPSLLDAIRAHVEASEMHDWLDAFARAHRGLFRSALVGPRARDSGSEGSFVLEDAWGGASFILMPAPPRELALALESGEGLLDGRLVGRADPLTVTLLPGAVFHPPDATPAIEQVIETARKEGLERDDALDALLRMEARLRAHSRVKPSYAYRAESLRRPTT